MLAVRGGGGGGRESACGAEIFMCLYSLKVQARPPRDQRLATQSSVSVQYNQGLLYITSLTVYTIIPSHWMNFIPFSYVTNWKTWNTSKNRYYHIH